MYLKNLLYLLLLSSFLFLGYSCEKDDDVEQITEEVTAKEFISDLMNEWYLWNEDLPDINPDGLSPDTYFRALLNNKDRWSFIDNLDELLAFLENGAYIGYGFSLKYDEQNQLRVKLVYDLSPIKIEGITRGWKLVKINDKSISRLSDSEIISELNKSSNSFVFEDNSGTQEEINLVAQKMNQNTVLHRETYNLKNGKVGYLVFDSFLGISEDELNNAFTSFKSEEVTELILDLRYNGGGSTNISNLLASLIADNVYAKQVYSKILHNNNKSDQNFSDSLSSEQISLNLNRVFIITTGRTASASEMLINGLKPYMDDVILIGSKTHGKPVGMYIFPNEELNLAVVPISFEITNSEDFGGYFNGIDVNAEVTDDLTHDFGDMEELCLKAALQYINTGSFEPPIALKTKFRKGRELPLKGFREMVGAF